MQSFMMRYFSKKKTNWSASSWARTYARQNKLFSLR